MDSNILCQNEEQRVITDFFESVSRVIRECDDCEEKEKIKEILHSMNETVSYIFLGEQGVGKTTLLKALFSQILDIQEEIQGDVCEYRYGEQNITAFSAEGYQKRFVVSEDLRGISVFDTRGLNLLGENSLRKVRELTAECQAILVVLEAGRMNSPVLWDTIEDFHHKNMVFVISKCDLLSEKDLTANIEKLKYYMKEADISAPIFPMRLLGDAERNVEKSLMELRDYIRKQLIGDNPLLARQQKNIAETRQLLAQMRDSFLLRSKQYQSDVEILHKINRGLDSYVMNQETIIQNLVNKVTEQIHKDIDAYQSEIISKMDPYKIKERFKTQQDFTDYLSIVNENYKRIMTDSVNQKAISAIKEALHELEMVYDDAVGYFNGRETFLMLNDKFYGSLALGRKQMVAETKENAIIVSRFYQTLTEASEELFLQVWDARRRHDEKLAVERTLTKIGGGVAGGVGGFLLAGASMAITPILVGIIGTIIGVELISSMAKVLYEPKADRYMEEVVQNCIVQFKEEINKTRLTMTEQITSQIRDIFKKELATVDGLFAEFRMSVNIDERKLPLLETQLDDAEKLLEAIDRL